MTWLANVIYAFAAALYLPVLLYQMVVQRKNRRGWRQRFGHVPRFDADRPRIWIHSVSLGEVNATRQLVAALRERAPGHQIVISTTTDTGYARACALFGPAIVFRYPLDFSWVIHRALTRIRPALIVLVELEVWYNLVTLASGRGIPVAVVNGRLTERSCRRLRLLGSVGRSMFARIAWVGAQETQIAERFRQVGVPPERIEVTGSVKWDTAQITDRIEGADALAAAMGIDRGRPLWVCGSTGPGEESLLLQAWQRARTGCPDLALAIVPRKPERFDQVAGLIRNAGYDCVRRSERRDETSASAQPDEHATACSVLLGDTMGELRKFYSLASVVFVGRSLVPMGGSDPMEAAALAKAVVVGPHTDNFAMPVACLRDANAIRIVHNANELGDEVTQICRHPELARRMGHAARDVVRLHQGATDRTADRLIELAPSPGTRSTTGGASGCSPAPVR